MASEILRRIQAPPVRLGSIQCTLPPRLAGARVAVDAGTLDAAIRKLELERVIGDAVGAAARPAIVEILAAANRLADQHPRRGESSIVHELSVKSKRNASLPFGIKRFVILAAERAFEFQVVASFKQIIGVAVDLQVVSVLFEIPDNRLLLVRIGDQ